MKREKPLCLCLKVKYLVAANYAVAKEKLGLVEMFVDYLMFVWWIMAGFAFLTSFIHLDNAILNAVLFLFGFIVINFVIGLPFQLYQTFKIDEDFGFNKMTAKMFILRYYKIFITLFCHRWCHLCAACMDRIKL